MSIHQGKQLLDVLVFFLCGSFFVLVELLNLTVSDLKQELLWLSFLESLRDSCLLHGFGLLVLGQLFCFVDHDRSRHAGLLIESILYELLL